MTKIEKLNSLIKELQNNLNYKDKTNLRISQASIGWHIEHSLIVIEKMIYGLELSNPKEYKWKFNWAKMIAFTLNRFPRGKAKAPKISLPKATPTIESISTLFLRVNEHISSLNRLDKNSFITHPYFGPLTRDEVIHCITIHTKHHLAIITDILKEK